MNDMAKGSVAEFIGTFALVFFGAGSIIIGQPDIGAGNLVTVALAHGIALAVFITACMYISGGQFNPAVSIGLFALKKQDATKTFTFVAAQLLAAACAAGVLVFTLGREVADQESVKLGATIGELTTAGNVKGVFIFEMLGTFALMFSVLAGIVDGRAHKLGGFCVGLTVAMCIVTFGPLTGASMNPARTFGPALYGHWDMNWVYWVAPITGSILACVVYKVFWTEGGDSAG